MKAELEEVTEKVRNITAQGKDNRAKAARKKQDLAELDTQDGKKLSKLDQMSEETGKAWRWVQENQNQFEKEVYGPPLISCSIKDPRYTDIIESFFRNTDYLTITAQTDNDFKKLQDQLFGKMRLAEFPLRKSDSSSLHSSSPPLSAQEMERFGLSGWALDFIDGPEPVLAMLCDSKGLNRSAISAHDITPEQYDAILQHGKLSQFVAGKSIYSVSRRREYGPQAVSTTTKSVTRAMHWVDGPVDTAAREAIESQINSLDEELAALKSEISPLKEKLSELRTAEKDLDGERVSTSSAASLYMLT